MFQPQFAMLVAQGIKHQTVRPTPKRLPKIGEVFSGRQWTGKPYRSKQRELVRSVVTRVHPVEIRLEGIGLSEADYNAICAPGSDEFARRDGFESYHKMKHWFIENHGLPFSGIVIYWK
jgi:hypothetical protein